MKVILTTPSLEFDSGALRGPVPALAAALAQNGVAAEVLAGSTAPARTLMQTGAPASFPVPISFLRKPPGPWWAGHGELRKALTNRQADILHDNGLWAPANHGVAAVAQKLRRPLVISPRGMLFEWAMKHQPGRKWLNWRLFQKRDLESAAVLHATSLLEADEFRNACLHPPIAIIPNGVEMPDKLDARMESSSVRTLLFAGAIRKSNGLLHLVTAWAQLRPKDWRVLIAGEDEAGHLAELRQAIAARGLEKEFAFSGGVAPANRWTLYREADLFISPGHPEDFGVEIAEALGCEVPVITTTAAPWRDLLDHRCGWWVPVGPKALTVALADAFKTSQAERSEMGQRGRKLIAGKYAWPLVAAQMKAVYDWLAGSGPKPASVV